MDGQLCKQESNGAITSSQSTLLTMLCLDPWNQDCCLQLATNVGIAIQTLKLLLHLLVDCLPRVIFHLLPVQGHWQLPQRFAHLALSTPSQEKYKPPQTIALTQVAPVMGVAVHPNWIKPPNEFRVPEVLLGSALHHQIRAMYQPGQTAHTVHQKKCGLVVRLSGLKTPHPPVPPRLWMNNRSSFAFAKLTRNVDSTHPGWPLVHGPWKPLHKHVPQMATVRSTSLPHQK